MRITIVAERTANDTSNRNWDYSAIVLEYAHEGSIQGIGKTPKEAILDLMEQLVSEGDL